MDGGGSTLTTLLPGDVNFVKGTGCQTNKFSSFVGDDGSSLGWIEDECNEFNNDEN